MERPDLVERLVECDLTTKEAEVFLELSTGGPGKASELARRVGISRMDAYNQLKRLTDRGIVRATVEKPMRFVALPVQDALTVLIAEREEAIRRIREHQEVLTEHIRPADPDAPIITDATFRIHQDRRTIHSQIRKMVAEANREVFIAATKRSIGRYATAGLLEEIRRHGQHGVTVRILTQVGEDNVDAVMAAAEGEGFELRHSDRVGSNLVIVDGTTILNSLVFDEAPGAKGRGDVALWTDSSDFVRAQTSFYAEAWEEATPLRERVVELRTGRVVEPIKAYLGEGSMYEKFRTLVRHAPRGRPHVPAHLLVQGTSYSLREFGIEIAHIFNLIGHRIGQEVAHDLSATEEADLLTEVASLWHDEGLGEMEVLAGPPTDDDAGIERALGEALEPSGGAPWLRVRDGFSPRGVEHVDRTVCSLDEGILAGIIETRLDRGCRVHEHLCVAAGAPYCLFEVRFLDAEDLRRLESQKTAHGAGAARNPGHGKVTDGVVSP